MSSTADVVASGSTAVERRRAHGSSARRADVRCSRARDMIRKFHIHSYLATAAPREQAGKKKKRVLHLHFRFELLATFLNILMLSGVMLLNSLTLLALRASPLEAMTDAIVRQR